MKRTVKLFAMLMLVASAGLMSCKKYDNGGSIKKAEKNIKRSWKIDSYYMDGSNQTANLLITNFVETFADGGAYTRVYNDASGDLKNETGTWSLDDDKSLINLSGPGSFELTAQTSTVSASNYTILKLTDEELWYEFSNGGNTHEFHMIAN